MNRALALLFVVILGSLPTMAGESGKTEPGSRPGWWGPVDESRFVFSVTGAREADTGNGAIPSVRITGGIWDLSSYDHAYHEPPGRWEAWLSYGSKDDQEISRLGMDWGPFASPWGPVRVGAYVRGGLEHRESDPKAGLGGSLGLGVDVTMWLHSEWNVGVQASRNFGISTKTWSDVGFCIRYSPKKLSQVLNP